MSERQKFEVGMLVNDPNGEICRVVFVLVGNRLVVKYPDMDRYHEMSDHVFEPCHGVIRD
jgi:hypothetical protein